jgi:hypothetical protein
MSLQVLDENAHNTKALSSCTFRTFWPNSTMAGPNTRVTTCLQGGGVLTGMCLHASALPAAAHASALCTANILGGVVRTIVMATRPENTILAYDPKQNKYYTFCDDVYKDYHISTRYTSIGTEKVFTKPSTPSTSAVEERGLVRHLPQHLCRQTTTVL